jgi:hypothetical protein
LVAGCFDFLCVAIEFGELDAFGNPTPVKGDGTGKILGVG